MARPRLRPGADLVRNHFVHYFQGSFLSINGRFLPIEFSSVKWHHSGVPTWVQPSRLLPSADPASIRENSKQE